MQNYSAHAHSPDFPGGLARGWASVREGRIVFSAPELEVIFPAADAEISKGGATGDQVFITHHQQHDLRITVLDPSFLRDRELRRFSPAARRLTRRRLWPCACLGCFVILLLLLSALISALWQMKEPLVDSLAARVPFEWEEKLGAAAVEQLRASSGFIEDPQITSQLEELARPLLAAIPDKQYRFKLYLAKDREVNAYAMPGGYLVINSGLILEADHPEEVLGVLAHEAAHVTRRHLLRQLINRAGILVLIQLALGDAGAIADIAEGGAFLLNQNYSRTYEREADETGWEYLQRADIDPRGMIEFFRKLQRLREGNAAQAEEWLEFLSTHPTTGDRIERLEEKSAALAEKRQFAPVEFDFAGFKTKVERSLRR